MKSITNNLFLMTKKVDWSLLTNGMTIPVEFQSLIQNLPNGFVSPGENRSIKIIIDSDTYDATLNSVDFDRKKYSTHKDLIQIRYSPNSPIAKRLQNIFLDSFKYLYEERQKPENYKRQIKLPQDKNEYIALYATVIPNVFVVECFTSTINFDVSRELKGISEYEYELQTYEPKYDENSSIEVKTSIQKVRHLDRSIGESLKKLYDYRCQVSGEKIGEEYGESVIQIHHIDYFTKSLNNDSSNIIIISPNFHSIIHKNNPVFNRNTQTFDFPNGVKQKLALNKHLEI